jgi:HD-like signal output (HDOD) protein
MTHLVAGDLALAAAMLKTVNSPFYGLAMRARSIQQALGLLGLRKTIGLATGLLLRHALPDSGGEVQNHLWDSSSRFAAGMARLARDVAGLDRDEAYTFGMFRDCGMLIFAHKQGDYARLVRKHGAPHGHALELAESAHYRASHAQVGFRMAQEWYLPDALCLAVLQHHNPAILAGDVPGIDLKTRRLVATGLLVDRFLSEAQSGVPGTAWEEGGAAVANCLTLADDDIAQLSEGVLDAMAGLDSD